MSESKFTKTKIAIIGAGAVGSTTAYVATLKNLAAEILLIDVNETKEAGEVMDITDGLCFVETGCIKGAGFRDARNADIVVITAGAPQKPGETRLQLVQKNVAILKSIFQKIGQLKKTAIIIMVANPVDILTYIAQEISGLPKNQVFGSGTTLDTARLRSEIGKILNVSSWSVDGFVLGEHGDSEFVAWSSVTIGGMSANNIKSLNSQTRKKIENRVKHEAYEIINRKGATFYGIALVLSDIIEAIIYDQHKILPISSRLNNWNGVNNICLGSPAVVGRSGVQKVWDLKLTAIEKKKLKQSADTLKKYLNQIK